MVVAVPEKVKTIRAFLSDPKVRRQLEMAIPKHLTVDRLLRVAMTSIQQNPRLLDCTPQSLLACVMMAAQLGLEPNPATRQAALVPFKNNKKGGIFEAQFQPMYMGLLALIRRTGELQGVQAQVVYTQDLFDLEYGLNEKLTHVPAEGNRGTPKGAYVVFRYKGGGYSFDYMSRNDIEEIRKRSKSADDGPWVTDWAEMAKKTVIKRHAKLAPMSIEFVTATALDDRALAGESQMDLLASDGAEPIQIEAGAPEEPEPGTADTSPMTFEKLVDGRIAVTKKVWTDADQKSLGRFLEETAHSNGLTIEQLKVTVNGENFPEFWESFEKWCHNAYWKPEQYGPGTGTSAPGEDAGTGDSEAPGGENWGNQAERKTKIPNGLVFELKDAKGPGVLTWIYERQNAIEFLDTEEREWLDDKCKRCFKGKGLAEVLASFRLKRDDPANS